MKIRFDAELSYQQRAVTSITSIFEGQEICKSNFTVQSWKSNVLQFENDLGYGNRLQLDEEQVLKNVQGIQLRNGLKQSSSLEDVMNVISSKLDIVNEKLLVSDLPEEINNRLVDSLVLEFLG